jgi:hypothetical protein
VVTNQRLEGSSGVAAEVAPYDAIKAPKEILSKGPKKGFVAPKDWKITKEK